MNLELRSTNSFIELKVDEIETTIFKDSTEEIQSTIDNLEYILNELYDCLGKDINIEDK